MKAAAFAPGNVSGVFKIVRDDDPRRMHSLGMGFTVAQGVTATVTEAPATEVSFNSEVFDFPTVRHVVESLARRPMKVTLESPLPLSGGFGLSGASALATAYALDAGLGLGLEERAIGMTAHVAEVTNLTGLGDVCGQFRGGCLAKTVPGDPLASVALPVAEQTVFYRYFSPIRTREIIGDPGHSARINAAADGALAEIDELAGAGVSAFERMCRSRSASRSRAVCCATRSSTHHRGSGGGRRSGVHDHARQRGVRHHSVRGGEGNAPHPASGEGAGVIAAHGSRGGAAVGPAARPRRRSAR